MNEKKKKNYNWAGLARAHMWVHGKLDSDGLALLVLLQIGAKEITVLMLYYLL